MINGFVVFALKNTFNLIFYTFTGIAAVFVHNKRT